MFYWQQCISFMFVHCHQILMGDYHKFWLSKIYSRHIIFEISLYWHSEMMLSSTISQIEYGQMMTKNVCVCKRMLWYHWPSFFKLYREVMLPRRRSKWVQMFEVLVNRIDPEETLSEHVGLMGESVCTNKMGSYSLWGGTIEWLYHLF